MSENKNMSAEVVETPETAQVEPAAETASVEATAAASSTPAVDPVAEVRMQKRREAAKKRRRKKWIKRIIVLIILLAVAAGVWYGVYKLFFEPEPVPEPQTTFSYRGSFNSSISGWGQVKANRTESVNAPAAGALLELLVMEGDTVYEGQPLFTMDDSALREQIAGVEKEIATLEESKVGYNESIDGVIKNRQKTSETRAKVYESLAEYDEQIREIQEKLAKKDLTAPFTGKLIEVAVREGDVIAEGQEVGVIVQDSLMKVTSYFSYAYENAISLGQRARVSIPANMEAVEGEVTGIEKVRYITEEGGVLFAVEVTIENPGALTEGMEALAVVIGAGGVEITPAEESVLEYYRTETLTAPAKGKILSLNMTEYAEYTEGETFYTVSGDGYAADIESLETTSESVREQVAGYDEQIAGYADQITGFSEQIAAADAQIAEKHLQIEELNAKFPLFAGAAPMSGLVTAVTAMVGQELQEGASILAISDTSAMTVSIELDERNVGSVSVGTPVDLIQYTSEGEQFYFGTITSIALEGNYDWGYTYYPAVVTIEGGEGLRANSSMDYNIFLSQKDDCILVPINAVKYTEQGACVFVRPAEGEDAPENAVELAEGVVPDGFYAVQVETGMSDTSQVEIVSGISEGVELFVAEGIPEDEMGGMIYAY